MGAPSPTPRSAFLTLHRWTSLSETAIAGEGNAPPRRPAVCSGARSSARPARVSTGRRPRGPASSPVQRSNPSRAGSSRGERVLYARFSAYPAALRARSGEVGAFAPHSSGGCGREISTSSASARFSRGASSFPHGRARRGSRRRGCAARLGPGPLRHLRRRGALPRSRRVSRMRAREHGASCSSLSRTAPASHTNRGICAPRPPGTASSRCSPSGARRCGAARGPRARGLGSAAAAVPDTLPDRAGRRGVLRAGGRAPLRGVASRPARPPPRQRPRCSRGSRGSGRRVRPDGAARGDAGAAWEPTDAGLSGCAQLDADGARRTSAASREAADIRWGASHRSRPAKRDAIGPAAGVARGRTGPSSRVCRLAGALRSVHF